MHVTVLIKKINTNHGFFLDENHKVVLTLLYTMANHNYLTICQ